MRSPSILALLPAIGFSLPACSPGDPPAPVVRLALDERIASVDSPELDVVRGDAPLLRSRPAVDDRVDFEDWSWFLGANAFGDGPLIEPASGASIDLLDRVDRGVLIPAGLGVAAAVPAGRRDPLEIELTGDFGREDGLAVLVVALDVAPPSFDELIRPGRLRELHRDHVVGSVHEAEPAGDDGAVRVRLRPVAAARSVLVLVSKHGEGEARLHGMTARWLSPFEALVGEGRVTERFVADALVDGEVRPSIALTPGTTVTTRPIAVPDGARLVARIGGVLGPRPRSATLRLDLLDDDGGVVRADERAIDLDEPRWTPFELELGPLAGATLRLRFAFEAPGADGVPVVFVGAPRIVAPPPEAPTHLLLVSLDTLRADRLGAYGNRRGLTPNIDRLAAEGTVFERAYANAPYTLPSHVTMLSGLLPPSHGVEAFRDRVPSAAPWLPEELADAGFETAAYTSGGYVGRAFGFGRGFDVYCEVDPIGDRYYPGRAIHNRPFLDGSTGAMPRVREWIRTRRGRPSFLFLHTYMAHDYLPPPELARRFGLLAEGEPPLTYEATKRFGAQRVAEAGLAAEDRRRRPLRPTAPPTATTDFDNVGVRQ
ncbi:MAG: sulfatase-like hydrolase/transferase [Planctomycetota bacterium JB042]